MLNRVLKYLQGHLDKLMIVFFGLVYLFLTLPALLTTHHVLYNLEPYPDGLLYAVSARNLVLGKGLELSYQGTHLPLWVPPLYAMVLSTGYFFWHAAQTFYLTNTLLGFVTLGLLISLAIKMVGKTMAGLVAGVIYLSHAYIVWLPTVPMSENVALLFLVLALYGLLIPKSLTPKILSLIGIAGLFLTRYAVVGTVLTLIGLNVLQVLPKSSKKKISLYIGLTVIAGVLGVVGLILKGTPIISMAYNFWSGLSRGSEFYSFGFMGTNLHRYLLIFIGQKTIFLWQQFAFTSFVVSVIGMFFLIFKLKSGNNLDKWRAFVLLSVVLSQFPLLLIFYVVDARYVIFALPIFALIWGWLITFLAKKYSSRLVAILFLIVIVTHLATQVSFFKQIIANNWLHRSRAWQYEAGQEFNSFFSNKTGSYLITALPPFFLDAYSQSKYRILPLSLSQEFLDKQEYVWGNDLAYDYLIANYKDFLKNGKMLYISNAYLSAEANFTTDFAAFQNDFNLEVVHQGCLQTCNIYKLSLKAK